MPDGIAVPQVDTSSYKMALPTGQSPLQTAQQLGGLEQQKIQIDQSKLKLMNDRFAIINNELSTLANDPSATREKVLSKINTLSRMGLVPKEQLEEFVKDVPQDNKQLKPFLEQTLQRGMSVMEKVNFQYGQINASNVGGQDIVTRTSPRFGITPTGQQFPHTLPSTTQEYDDSGRPKFRGPQPYQFNAPGMPVSPPSPVQQGVPLGPPAGATEARPIPVPATPITPGGLPTSAGAPRIAPTGLPVAQPPATGAPIGGPPRGQSAEGPVWAGPPPGVVEAETQAGSASGEQLAKARVAAASFQRDIFPLTQAIPALEKLGTKGTGPGTEEINQIRSFILSNVPGVRPEHLDFKGTIEDFDKAKKYLTDYVNQTGNVGTNDKLAASFAGNPSVGISNAAAIDVAKSALALRRMQQAITLDFERKGLPASQYSRYVVQLTNSLDPRAFGVDLLKTKEKKDKLMEDLNKNPIEKENFEKSLGLAVSLGILK